MRAMTRRALALVLTLAMALSLCLAAQAAGPQVTVTLDGTALELEDGSPFELSCTPDRSYVFRRV